MERHHEARQAAQQAFLEALEQLHEDLISGAESEEPALFTAAAPLAPVSKLPPLPPLPPLTPATARLPGPPRAPHDSASITFEDLEAAIEDIEQYMHWQEETVVGAADPEEPAAIARGDD